MGLPETSAVFQAAEAKLRRAFQDLEVFNTNYDSFLDPNPYSVTVKYDRESDWWIGRMDAPEELPPDLGVLVGAIAYQSLSAFNLLVWELAARKIGRRKVHAQGTKNHVQLPIALNAQAFADNPLVTRRLVSKRSLTALEGLQPYKDGHGPSGPEEHPLPLIKEIADSDKHRVLTGVFGQGDMNRLQLGWDRSAASSPEVDPFIKPGAIISGGTPIFGVRFRRGNAQAKVYVKRQPEFVLFFQTDSWTVARDSVNHMLKWAYMKLMDLAPLFPAK